jgi:two-component system, chemotaxis family, response regulator Rcp1
LKMAGKMRILVAEDNPGDVFLIEEALREHEIDFELIVAEDGEQALTILNSDESFDAVLLDLNMPKRGGSEVLEKLQGRNTPVIILTSSDSPADRLDAMEKGVTRYIRKPSGLDDFLAIGRTIKEIICR